MNILKILKFILPRFLISFVLVFGISYLFFIFPKQSDNRTINNHVNDVQSFDQSLQKARERLKDLPNPSSITSAKAGAKNYAYKLAEAKGAFTTKEPAIPKPIINKKKDTRINNFNLFISNPSYKQAIIDSSETLRADQSFLSHESVVMLALSNLLEYSPQKDLGSNDKNELAQHLQATAGGLDTTTKKLKQIPMYAGDLKYTELSKLILDLQNSRDKLANSISKDDYEQNKTEFINKVVSTQNTIILNRDDFWKSESQKLFTITDKNQKTLNFYLTQLIHI